MPLDGASGIAGDIGYTNTCATLCALENLMDTSENRVDLGVPAAPIAPPVVDTLIVTECLVLIGLERVHN